jgi:hypothetical protein
LRKAIRKELLAAAPKPHASGRSQTRRASRFDRVMCHRFSRSTVEGQAIACEDDVIVILS